MARNNEFFKAKNISFELYENEDFYHIQPYTYVPYLNYDNKVIDRKIEFRGCGYFSTDITINEINDFFRDNLKDKKYMLYKYLWT